MTIKVVDAVAIQPAPAVVAVATTVYVVVTDGVTVVEVPVAPVFHSYDTVPVPVALTESVAGLPTQRVDGVADTLVILTDGVSTVTATCLLTVAVHSPTVAVAITM